MSKNDNLLVFKAGLFSLAVLQLPPCNLGEFAERLAQTVSKSPKFFQHAPVLIDLQAVENSGTLDFDAMIDILRHYQLIPVGVRAGNEKQQKQALDCGLAVFPADKNTTSPTADTKSSSKHSETAADSIIRRTKLITQPVRSGQRVYAKDGDLIITSSVSDGAEILADGNIHVYGVLRGRALAGMNGDAQARIFCQKMEAQLVAIAGHYLVFEEPVRLPQTDKQLTQIFYTDGKVCIEPVA